MIDIEKPNFTKKPLSRKALNNVLVPCSEISEPTPEIINFEIGYGKEVREDYMQWFTENPL